MAMTDPFARKDHRVQRLLAVVYAAFALLVTAASGWRHAGPMLALAVGAMAHVAFGEVPPSPRGDRAAGTILVRLSHRRVLRSAVGILASGAVLLVERVLHARGRDQGVSPLLLSAIVLWALVLAIVPWRGLREQVRITLRGLERRPAWGSIAKLSWSDVEEIRGEGAFVLRGRGVEIRVGVSLDGVGDFAAAVLANAPATAIDAHAEDKAREWLLHIASLVPETRRPMVRE